MKYRKGNNMLQGKSSIEINKEVADLREIQSILLKVYKIESEVRDLHQDPHLEIGEQADYEIWPNSGTRPKIGGKIIVRTWDLFENVYVPSMDRDTPDDHDSIHRGTHDSLDQIVVSLVIALACRDIHGKLESYYEGKQADEIAAATSEFEQWRSCILDEAQ